MGKQTTEIAKTAKQTTELATLDGKLAEIQRVADETSMAKIHDLPFTTKAIKISLAMGQLRKLFDGEVLEAIMGLMDSNLGFKTDRKPGTKDKNGNPVKPYHANTVRDCAIEALLRGASAVGNEFNILVGNCYLTKEYYERLVRGLVQNLRVTEGVPTMQSGGALVSMRASWTFNGNDDSIDCIKTPEEDNRIPVRVNSGMGADAIIGKAYRKLYAKIHRRVTGSTWLEEETSDTPGEVVAVMTAGGEIVHGKLEAPSPEEETEAAAQAADPDTSETVHSENPIFIGIQKLLESKEQLTDVRQYKEATLPLCESEEEEVLLTEWCDWRSDQIRESRGSRSNKSQQSNAVTGQ